MRLLLLGIGWILLTLNLNVWLSMLLKARKPAEAVIAYATEVGPLAERILVPCLIPLVVLAMSFHYRKGRSRGGQVLFLAACAATLTGIGIGIFTAIREA